MKEVEEKIKQILKEHDCHLEVDFVKEVVMGNTVLVYKIIIVENVKEDGNRSLR